MYRRKLLATGGTALALGLAGCASETDDGNGDDREEGSTNDTDDGGDGGDTGTSDGGDTDSSGGDPVELLDHEWYQNSQYDAGVSGSLENVSGEELSYVEVSVYFLDEDGAQVGEGIDNTSDLSAGRVWKFDATYLDGEPQTVTDYEIETDVSNY
ncbi:hypothetical protein A6E15_19195 [Natrinema saccharevitans]|uniref:Uncharacterized protein n=1 Tax=Natrinema saccharevitans TaxID=301967 RepID=A0A1S8ARE6_9EURY|nr:FxLYD domain-containing protein [Natrinema saccharevitans]OLZ39091.1 hypothetical protein A6E15_19195 [Natrinema saccharevitans]